MKNLLLSVMSLLLVSALGGCADKRLILIPQSSYYPTFPTQDFIISGKKKIDTWEESEDVNGTTINYLVAEKKDLLEFFQDTKQLRSDYNLLLKKVQDFNTRIKELNKIQNEKKPTEVEDIKDSWFK